LLLATVAPAHDLAPAPWRGERGTTYQEWRFDDDDNPSAPEVIQNPVGGALAVITLGLFGEGWQYQLDGLGTQTGYWDLGGEGGQIVVTVPVPPWPLDSRDVWIQVTYYRDISQPPTVGIDVPGAVKNAEQTLVVEAVPTGGQWLLHQSSWSMDPYPGEDHITVLADAMWGSLVDQIVVETRADPPCNDPFADADGDGDVDQSDFGRWQACETGDGGGVPPGCGCFDRDEGGLGDGDIDGDDALAFEACATGPGIPVDAGCDGP
jgi:hypothetical protein